MKKATKSIYFLGILFSIFVIGDKDFKQGVLALLGIIAVIIVAIYFDK